MLFVLGTLLTPQASAQCPPGYVGPYTTTLTVMSPTCGPIVVTVSYCHTGPTLSPPTYWINSISTTATGPGGTPCVDGIVFRNVGRALIETNAGGFVQCVPGCWQIQHNTAWATCYREYTDAQGVTHYVMCGAATQGCGDSYIICCDPGSDGECGTSDDGPPTAYIVSGGASDECGSGDPECKSYCPPPPTPENPPCL